MAPPNETIVRPRHDQFRTRRFRRARIACLSCRRRKVRCNVDSDGTPCINCRLDNCECITHWKRTETDAAAIENTIATTRTEISSEQSARTSGPESSTVIEEIDADDESPPVEDASEKDAASHAETPKLQQLQPPQHFGGTSGDSRKWFLNIYVVDLALRSWQLKSHLS